jgi:predicted dehydrogenase
MLRIGLIGCGGIGAVHAKVYQALKDKVALAAIADFNMERAGAIADACSATVYRDAHEMLEREALDLVDICLPTALHAEYVMAALSYVKHVLVEKPICLTVQEAEALLAKEKEYGATVHVAHVGRFATQYIYLKQALEEGRYGRLLAADFYRLSPKPIWVKDYDNPQKTGGMPIDLHIHDVDYIRHLMGGDPDTVKATAAFTADGGIRQIWSAYVYGNAVITAECSWDLPVSMPFQKGYRAVFEKATLLLSPDGVLTVYPEEGDAFVPKLEKRVTMDLGINVKGFGTFLYELSLFVDAISEGRESPVSLLEAVGALRLVQKELLIAKGDAT